MNNDLKIDHRTTDRWDEAAWASAEPIYEEAFPEHGRKNKPIVRRMFERGICTLHSWHQGSETIAMALTAYDARTALLVIDYIAVRRSRQRSGVGRRCIGDMREWAVRTMPGCLGMVIEVEADESEENAGRIRFWQQTGFRLTAYVHAYVWVPETYRAMYLPFDDDEPLLAGDDGRTLFKAITRYHERAYRSK
ncbi:GNAT family N-acetyltransferase [Paenibacillus rhizovicinus]|uniref:GNAT family N-acetyltransferase n=1 Tax=Paenibacillus rhizovicinus TaxID=2704463 RepID=A0A6C0P8N3_9BACL|nr:GNAT family N-acetyltransferase [Paenibacillus rhizovicinus]QHW34751.1 GNAT family N-acetyltransferase [Paenibacillus rhizovicinus]